MAVFKCKMCGGDLEVTASIGSCQYCGTRQTLPKLDDDKRVNLYGRANHYRRQNDFDKAAAVYESILNEDRTDAEAYWSLVLCKYGVEYVEDPTSHKRIPTCNRTQYSSILTDEDYKQALVYADEYQRNLYEEEAWTIDGIQKGILEISAKEEPFDIFICYKETDSNGRRTPDSVLAQDMYHQLADEGYNVFFSRITLEDKIGIVYEPYIFSALQSSKIMVVVGTKQEYFNAVWVKNEWSRYLSLIKEGKKKVLIPAYRDMDAYDLPDEFSHLQAQDMGKLGFMQDLIRGIKKILTPITAAQPAPTLAVETDTVSGSGLTPGIVQLIDRAGMLLEDGEFQSADEYYTRALDLEPRNAQAYLGKLLASLKLSCEKGLAQHFKSLDEYSDFRRAMQFGDDELKKRLESYNSAVFKNLENTRVSESAYQQALTMAQNYDPESLLKAAALLDDIGNYKEADKLSAKWRKIVGEVTTTDHSTGFGGLSWRILTIQGKKALLITVEVIEERAYDEGGESESVTWATCSLRQYLNNEFLERFSLAELEQIVGSVNGNLNNDLYRTDGGTQTPDKVFLLSVDEAEKYFANDEARRAKLNQESSWWWLRSPGEYAINAAIVSDNGEIDPRGDCVDYACGIRPALWRIMDVL